MAVPFSVVILAGGSARRMGSSTKGFQEVGGREILERELDATRECRDVILATGDVAPYCDALRRYGWKADPVDGSTYYSGPITAPETRRVRILPDREPGLGPLAGLVGGLEAAVEDRCWVLSCDLPFVEPEVGAVLVLELNDRPIEDRRLAVVPIVGGRPQPLCSAYRREARRPAARALERGSRSMRSLLEAIPVRYLPEEDLQPLGDVRRLLLNVNTPEDLQTARRWAETD